MHRLISVSSCRRWTVRAALLILIAPPLTGRTAAATFTVDRLDDNPTATACDDATADDCSLRGAVIAADALAEASTIVVPAGHYLLTTSAGCSFHGSKNPNDVIPVGTVALCLTKDITLDGAGVSGTILDANQPEGDLGVLNPVLIVDAFATVVVKETTITKGNFSVGAGYGQGGGVHNSGTLTLVDATLTANYSSGPGGAVYNQAGLLTLVRTEVSLNASPQAGGGLYNYFGIISVVDSVLTSNEANLGGAVCNFAGETHFIGSTIKDNIADEGGGLYNSNFDTMTLTNSTVSGNFSRRGGGIFNEQAGIMRLANVTVTHNTVQWAGYPGAATGGGVDTSDDSSFTVRNSIIAGNSADGPSPDCDTERATLISEGHNIIQNTTHCPITGDTTGNVIGQDPGLGVLADNGGPTPTHAPLPNSPALDAGDPGEPGSGGTACTATDQRGFPRPVGAACDIGAVERVAAFTTTGIKPTTGGNGGTLIAHIAGTGFASDAAVKLVRAGQAEIVGDPTAVDQGGSAIATSFDLTGKAIGAWDVVVTNAGQETATLPGAFAIDAAEAPNLWVGVVGPRAIRPAVPALFILNYGNHGNADAFDVPLTLSFPSSIEHRLLFLPMPPPAQPGQLPLDWFLQATDVLLGTGDAATTNVSLLLPVVPAGFTGTLQFTLTLPTGAPHGTLFSTVAAIGEPLAGPHPSAAVIDAFVQDAHAYAKTNFDLDLPSSLDPALADYARGELEGVADLGREALVSGLGNSPVATSLPWLVLDLALYAAGQALPHEQVVSSTWPARLAAVFAPASAVAEVHVCPLTPCKTTNILPEGCSCTDIKCDQPCLKKDANGFCIQVNHECFPPPLPLPPGCDLFGKFTVEQFLANVKNCRMTKELCESLPNQHVVTNPDGSSFCVPNGSGKHCPRIQIPNPLGVGSLDCIGTPINLTLDPNDKSGPPGEGDAHWITRDVPLRYLVQFENDPLKANAAVQTLAVTDQLDPSKVDLATFELGPISFGSIIVPMPPGVTQYVGGVDLRPAQNLIVKIDAGLDGASGLVTWNFTSLDPDTMELTTDPDAGFLPPDQDPPEGEGSVHFTVAARAEVTAGTSICNAAAILFDVNDPLDTPTWCNVIDDMPPASAVSSAVASCTGNVDVRWTGTDVGAGVASYTILVAEDGGPATPWLVDTLETSGIFAGQPGHVYAFSSIARDVVGNQEDPPAAPDAVAKPPAACCHTDPDCNDGNVCNGQETCTGPGDTCRAGIGLSCDDAEPCTNDTCDPVTGCAHTAIPHCSGACPPACDDGDPCTADRCIDSLCINDDLTGLPAAACVCQRAPAAACTGVSIPSRITKRSTTACNLLRHAAGSTSPKRTRKLLTKAAANWSGMGKLLAGHAAKHVPPPCVAALTSSASDALTRTLNAEKTP